MPKSDSVTILKELSESFGPSGFERETARIVMRYIKGYADEITTDKLGSVIFRHDGSKKAPKVLLAGHIDEVGFVITGIDKSTGFLTFNPLGGWFDQVLLGHRVIVRSKKGDIHGVIAAKPPHLLPPEERDKVVKLDHMFIDVGASSGEETEKMGIRIGDPVTPWSPFQLIRDDRIAVGKAFDDRVGSVVALETLRRLKKEKVRHQNTVYGATTVQEEVGLRGAGTVAHAVEPDVAIALDVDIAGDVPGIKPNEAPTKMGKGISILTFDASMIPNQALKRLVIETAEREKIPYQLSVVARGGTDAGRFHISRSGCPSIVIGVPVRHIHSHAAMVNLDDIENAIKLNIALIKRLDDKTVRSLTSIES